MAITSVRVTVFDSRIDAMTKPGGSAFKYTYKKTRTTHRHAVAEVPVRSGRLRGSIRIDVRPLARNKVIGRVRAGGKNAPYAHYVHDGTESPIWSDYGGPMFLPAWGPHPRVKAFFVSGQDPNPFLARALSRTFRAG